MHPRATKHGFVGKVEPTDGARGVVLPSRFAFIELLLTIAQLECVLGQFQRERLVTKRYSYHIVTHHR